MAGTAGVIGIKNGSGGAAQFNFPVGAAFNGAGYIFVADAYNNVIRTTKSIAGITWGTPSSITYGTGLGGAQLNASSGVSGTFTYTPPSGAVLNTGTNTLNVILSPADTTDYTGATTNVNVVVTPASLIVTANNATRSYGATNPTFTGTITGIQNSDNISATYSSSATPSSAPGNYSIIPTLVDPNDRETNYNVTIDDGTLFVVVTQPGVFQSIGLQTNGTILLNVSGATNATYTLDVSTDLISWTPLMTFTMTNGAVQLNDATSTNYSARYYLLESP